MDPVLAVLERPGPSAVGPVPSELTLDVFWGEAGAAEGAQEPEQCHVSVGPGSTRPDQQHWYMDPSNSSCPA